MPILTSVDSSTIPDAMSKSSQSKNHTTRQIVGLSLPPDLAREVKQEAARRGLRLKDLFLEIWQLYKTKSQGAGKG